MKVHRGDDNWKTKFQVRVSGVMKTRGESDTKVTMKSDMKVTVMYDM